MVSHAAKVPPPRVIEYRKHPTLAPTQTPQKPLPMAGNDRRTSMLMQSSQPAPTFSVSPMSESTHAPQHHQQQPPPPPPQDPIQQPSFQTYNNNGHSYPSQGQPSIQPQAPPYSNASVYAPITQNPYSQSEYSRAPPATSSMPQQRSGVTYSSTSPPLNPVFGVSLDELFRRDGSPVPMVVYQCIQAVDLFGLEVEGIYRIPGTSSHIQALRALFDSGMSFFSAVLHPLSAALSFPKGFVLSFSSSLSIPLSYYPTPLTLLRRKRRRFPQPRSLPARCQLGRRPAQAVLPRAARSAPNTRPLCPVH